MKRHPALVPVSRQHHDLLTLALEIRRDMPDPAADRDGFDRFAAGALGYFDEHVVRHFNAEERVLFAAARTLSHDAAALIDEVSWQHEDLCDLIERIRERLDDPIEARRLLLIFGAMLRGHVRAEEDRLFPTLERTVAEEALRTMGAALERELPPQICRMPRRV